MGFGVLGWLRKLWFPPTAMGLALLLQATIATAGDLEDCLSDQADAKIRGCTALIASGPSLFLLLDAYKSRSKAYRELGALEKSLEDISLAINLISDSPESTAQMRIDRGRLLSELGRHAEAVEDFSSVLKLADIVSVRVGRAKAYEKIGRRTEAIDDFRAAMFSQNAGTEEMAVSAAGLNRLDADPTPIKSPETILDDFGVGADNPYISKRLLAFLSKDETENLMILDFDPTVDGQDALITESKYSLMPYPYGDQMEWWVTNTFKNFDQPSKVRYQIARENNIWKVFNIFIGDWNLLGMYVEAFSNQQPSANTSDAAAPILPCDDLAGHPEDETEFGNGLKFADIEADRAILACLEALKSFPYEARFQFQLGRAYDKRAEYGLALKWYTKAAKNSYGIAMNNIGILYENGEGVPKSLSSARSWFERSANADFTRAKYNIATYYEEGKGGPRNARLAAERLVDAIASGSNVALKKFIEKPSAWRGDTILELQIILRRLHLYSGTLDGKYGPGTKSAMEGLTRFQ